MSINSERRSTIRLGYPDQDGQDGEEEEEEEEKGEEEKAP
jgi:hypothetical protein